MIKTNQTEERMMTKGIQKTATVNELSLASLFGDGVSTTDFVSIQYFTYFCT